MTAEPASGGVPVRLLLSTSGACRLLLLMMLCPLLPPLLVFAGGAGMEPGGAAASDGDDDGTTVDAARRTLLPPPRLDSSGDASGARGVVPLLLRLLRDDDEPGVGVGTAAVVGDADGTATVSPSAADSDGAGERARAAAAAAAAAASGFDTVRTSRPGAAAVVLVLRVLPPEPVRRAVEPERELPVVAMVRARLSFAALPPAVDANGVDAPVGGGVGVEPRGKPSRLLNIDASRLLSDRIFCSTRAK